MLSHENITVKKAVRICSRPDMGIVTITDIVKYGKLWSVRTSKGGIFDEYDIVGLLEDEERSYRGMGTDTVHSKGDWLKKVEVNEMFEFHCKENGKVVTLKECKACYAGKDKEKYVTRLVCKAENKPKMVSMKLDGNFDINELRKDNIKTAQEQGVKSEEHNGL